ncbi:putative ribonuclease H protein [Citrus sinensis]|uniref:Ribonuclease H protein n=1 Tax=Citrus sinensis TaxID=2711 RepID=A0ACB8LBR6_CITSI|nr:putative ribonuclease H protein [Citrus sinensis]
MSSENIGSDKNLGLGFENSNPPPLQEDRTTKKARFRAEGTDADNPHKPSWRDKAMEAVTVMAGQTGSAEEDWDIEDEDVVERIEEGIPAIYFSNMALEILWRSMVAGFSIIDLENNYFLVKFQTAVDAERALTEGPWIVMGRNLFVQPWTPNFDCFSNELTSTVVWVRLPGMAIQYYDKHSLRRLGSKIGDVIKIDYNTEDSKRGKFTRLAVRVSLVKPLVSQIKVNGKIQLVEYEGLPMICFSCGKYGHFTEDCGEKILKETGTTKTVANNAPVVVNEKNIRGAETGGNKFGPWMIVSRKDKPRNYAGNNFSHGTGEEQPNVHPSNSRFVVLASQDTGDNEHEHVATDSQDKETSHANPKQSRKNYVLQPHALEFKRRHSTRIPSKFTNKGKSPISQRHHKQHTTIIFHNPNNNPIDTHELDGAAIQMSRGTKGLSLPYLGDPPDLYGGDTDLKMEADPNYVEDEDDEDTTEGEESFVEDTPMIMFWNVQGAGASEFRMSFAVIIQCYNPSMVVIFEPRISGQKADNFIQGCGFERSHMIEAVGFSGGIWLLWKDFITVEVALNHRQFVHFKIVSSNGLESWVTAVYYGITLQVLLLKCRICGWMLDLKFSGPRFTWSRGNLSKRLDIAVCNDRWLIKHANSSVMHLPKIDSDHRPILVKFQNMDSRHGGPRPFRFLAAWLTDERRWNKEIFGNIIYRKRKLLARIGGIQRILETKPNHSLTRLEVKLQKELDEVLTQEELLWLQKSRRDWTLYGDRNTAYFHKKTLTRRRQNRITAILNDTGQWIHDVEIIQQLAVRFFSELYTPEQGVHRTYNVRGCFPVLSDDFCLSLMFAVTDEEIRRTIFSMSPFKAPGVDGFDAGFYKAQWNTVDDLLLFLDASYGQVNVLNDVVENFCRSSGARVSNQKTQVFFSKNVPVTLASGIGKALCFSITNNLGRYLGMPLLHDRVSKKTYQSIIDKIDQRLSGWAAKHLSVARRVTLAQSVLQAIPIYAMQTTYLPSSVRVKIDQLCRRFIWSGVLISKYAAPCDMTITDASSKNVSYLWRSMRKIWKDFQKGLRWSIGNGQRVKFWDDIWATNGDPLINYTMASIPDSMRNMLVADCVDQNGNWLWNRFNSYLNNHVVLKIASMAPPSSMRGDDRVYWGASNTGIFIVQSAYQVLTNFYPADDCQDWRQLWKWKGLQSVSIFLWLLCHDRLKTRYELARRHLDIEPLCGRCHADVESSLHAIRDCAYSRGVWRKLVPTLRQHDFFSYPLRQWIMTNLRGRVCDMGSLFWPVMFGIAAWRIWYWRNQVMFNNKNWNGDLIVRDIKARAESICSTLSSVGYRRNERIQKWIRWAPLPWPFLCLNTDGARKGNGEASAGGLLRDCHGNFIHGFSANLGVCSVAKAELWGVLHGLRMAWDLGYIRI